MNLEPTDDQRALRDTVRRFLAAEAPVAAQARRVTDDSAWAPDAAWKGLADLGALGVLVPTSGGGAGLGLTEAAMVAEELGRVLYPGPWVPTAVASVRALEAVGGQFAEEMQAVIADGSVRSALTLDPMRMEEATVSGTGRHVLGGEAADVILVPVESDGTLALHAVEPRSPGVAITAEPSVDATQSRATVTLAGARARRIGAIDVDQLAAVRDDVLVALAADALGAAQAVLELAIEYAKEREQFGQPIGAFQAVAHLCVDMYETVELARGGVLHAAWAADAGVPSRHLAALRLKAFSDRLASVADSAIQVFGGVGYTWEHDAHLYLRRLLSWAAGFGPASSHRIAVGRALAAGPVELS